MLLAAIIGPSGLIAKARVVRGIETPALRSRLVECLRGWRFEPATYRGERWAVEWHLTLNFWPPSKGVSGYRNASSPNPSFERAGLARRGSLRSVSVSVARRSTQIR
jgi:hypothetical protein